MSKELRNEYLFSHSLHNVWDCEVCRKYRGCNPTENHSRHCFNYSPKGMMEYEDDLLGWQVLNKVYKCLEEKLEEIPHEHADYRVGYILAMDIIKTEQLKAGINYD